MNKQILSCGGQKLEGGGGPTEGPQVSEGSRRVDGGFAALDLIREAVKWSSEQSAVASHQG